MIFHASGKVQGDEVEAGKVATADETPGPQIHLVNISQDGAMYEEPSSIAR